MLPKLYAITDVQLSGLPHAEQVARMATGGARLIQLRDKHSTPRAFHRDAAEALKVAHDLGAKIIINDRVDIALALAADGIHLGQEDMPPSAARRLLGPTAIIGLSTHNVQQALEALNEPVDYIALGPIFSTRSKEKPDPVVGLEGLQKVRAQISDKPLVAIGGIGPTNFRNVLQSGADSVAMIGALLENHSEISERVKRLISNLAD
jgi:thiamine-phosphate pyrophosphorylase